MSLTDKLQNAASWCKSQVLYYLVYTPEERAMLNRVSDLRKAGQIPQIKSLEKYSDEYWRIRNELGKHEDSQDDKF